MVRDEKPTVTARYQFTRRAGTLSWLEHHDGEDPGSYLACDLNHSLMSIPIAGLAKALKHLVVGRL
jgi:hypothetical protein